MAANRSRPLSPHLTIWRWGVHMAVSILHRATGTALAIAAVIGFVWWLTAAAAGAEAYALFYACATGILGKIIGVGLSWAFFQHLFSGIRHLVLDTGAGYELKTNKFWATMTIIGSVLLTAILWAPILLRGA